MKKRPLTREPKFPAPSAYQAPGQEHPQDTPQSIGDGIQTFVQSGGATTFLFDGPSTFNPQIAGAQMLCSVFVPRGRTGWIKQIRVAPFMPAVLANPWQGWDATWQNFAPVGAAISPFRATAQAGYYTTPLGWESYFDPGTETLPQWVWWISCITGTIAAAKFAAHSPEVFSFADPNSWYLAPDIAVPLSTYTLGFTYPGRAPALGFGRQRMQVLPDSPIDWHLQIPENSTAILWCEWKQSSTSVYARDINGPSLVMVDVPPLLPSFGQLVGYTQSTTSKAAVKNARRGWGG
jgi:hypothetical protein